MVHQYAINTERSQKEWIVWLAGLGLLALALLYMNQEILRVGFLPIVVKDLLDVGLVTLIVYKLYSIMRGTRAAQMAVGMFILLIVVFMNGVLKLSGISWIIENLKTIWLIGFVILFQPELRRSLILLGQSRLVRFFVRIRATETIEIIARAAIELSQKRYGALIVIVRDTGVKAISETGVRIQASVSAELIVSLFFPRSPLHDGAVVITGDLVESAKAILPLTQNPRYRSFGTRHQAAVGLSEESDAMILIVSEETGQISVALNGNLRRGLSAETLTEVLAHMYEERPTSRAA